MSNEKLLVAIIERRQIPYPSDQWLEFDKRMYPTEYRRLVEEESRHE